MPDFPFDEIAKAVEDHAKQGALCFQKWSCAHCKARQTMSLPNVLYRQGKCEECGKITQIDEQGCNYMLMLSSSPENQKKFLREWLEKQVDPKDIEDFLREKQK